MANQKLNQEYVLKRKPNGRHYQRWIWLGNPKDVVECMWEVYNGTLDGNVPGPDEKNGSRSFSHANGRVLIKLTVLRTVTHNPDGSVTTS